MSHSTGFYLRESSINDKPGSIKLRVIIDRKKRYYPTGQKILPKDWDGHQVKSRYYLSEKINKAINTVKIKADDIFLDLQNDGIYIDFESFEERFLKNRNPKDVYQFFEEHLKNNRSKFSEGYYKHLNGEMNKLKEFAPSLTFGQITREFLERYEKHMRETLKNKTNTIHGSLKRLRIILHQASLKGLIHHDPFAGYRVNKEPANRQYLTLEKLQALENIDQSKLPEGMRDTLRAFIFCCYTGLRYQDIFDLTHDNIKDGAVQIVMHKTRDIVSIPLCENAKKMIDSERKGNLFTMLTNQKSNVYLKSLAILAGIESNLTFHVSRHTFATISLNIGIPIEVVSRLMGHTDIKTTQIYAKIMDKTKVTEMKKWDNL